MLFAVTCNAQEVKLVEKLADGSYVVSIAGVEYRALAADRMRTVEKNEVELTALRTVTSEQQKQIQAQDQLLSLAGERNDLQKKISDSLQTDLDRTRADSARWQNLFTSERELRQESQQFIPHGSTTKWDKLLGLFDSQGFQFTLKAAIPVWTAVRCK